MDIITLINEVVDNISSCESKQQSGDKHKYEPVRNYRVEALAESDLDKLRKILNEAAILRLHPLSFCDRRRNISPEHPLTATEIQELIEEGNNIFMRYPLQPLRLEPEPEPHQEMWMHDHPTAVRW